MTRTAFIFTLVVSCGALMLPQAAMAQELSLSLAEGQSIDVTTGI